MYRITHANVARNKLFLLHNIEVIDYRPESIYQVLMGDNGSGKSTLLRLLTGYDPEKDDFHQGGGILLKLVSDGTEYEVGYEVGKGISYTFKVDGEELNNGHTREVYRSLWETELGVTPDTVALLTRKHQLTDMRPAQRQELFSTITGVDMSYGLACWDKLKRKTASIKGAIAENRNELTLLVSQRVDDAEVEVLRKRAIELREQAQEAMLQYRNDLPEYDPAQARNVMARYQAAIHELRAVTRAKPACLPVITESMDAYAEEMRKEHTLAQSIAARATTLLDQFEQMDDLYRKLQYEASRGHADFDEEAYRLKKGIEQLTTEVYYVPDLVYQDIEAVHKSLSLVLPGWQQKVMEFRGGKSIAQMVTRRDELHAKLSELQRGINTLTGAIESLEAHLKHLREPHNDHCVKCGYSAGEDHATKAAAVAGEKIAAYSARLATGRKLHAEHSAEYEETCRYINELQDILRVTEQYPALKPFFDHVFTEASLFDNPGEVVDRSALMYLDVEAKVRVFAALCRLDEIGRISKQLAEQSVGTLEGLAGKVEQLRESYESTHAAWQSSHDRHAQMQATHQTATQYLNSLESALRRFDSEYQNLSTLVAVMLNHLSKLYYTEQVNAAVAIETQLGERTVLEARISGMEEHIAKLEAKYTQLQVLMETLSPQTGLLAKFAVKPIERFIEQMNYIIARVWSHELRVLPYRQGKHFRMDYTFPMVVAGRDTLVPDVSEGSDGQLEIVNFAFMITGLLCKGNKGIPLLLDEIDRPLQPAHKEALMAFLTEMVESGWFSQIFVVSHHASAYTALPSPDMIELTPQPHNPAHNRVVEFR